MGDLRSEVSHDAGAIGAGAVDDGLSEYLSNLDLQAAKREEDEKIFEQEQAAALAAFEAEALGELRRIAAYAGSIKLPEGWTLESRHTAPTVLELSLNTPHGEASVFLEAISREEGARVTWVKDHVHAPDVASIERLPLHEPEPSLVDNLIKELAADATTPEARAKG